MVDGRLSSWQFKTIASVHTPGRFGASPSVCLKEGEKKEQFQ